jgi:phospholipid/cholesterol/gamma-HCH transport system permease protein
MTIDVDEWAVTDASGEEPATGRAVTSPHAPDPGSATREIADWGRRYVRMHPLLSLDTLGDQVQMGLRTLQYLLVDLFTGRFVWREFIQQAGFMAGTAFAPTVFVTIPLGVTVAIQFSVLAGQVGATSLAGAGTGIFTIRQGAPLVSAVMLATAVGSAVCADLGARTMREEIDAMEVMGVSPIRRMVVPRFVAVVLVGLALTGWTCFVGFLSGYMFNVFMQDGAPGSFVDTYASFATTDDYLLGFIKSAVFATIVAIVSCHKGLRTRGGPAGVANSVNAAVVESILLLMIVNVILSQLYILIFPRTSL